MIFGGFSFGQFNNNSFEKRTNEAPYANQPESAQLKQQNSGFGANQEEPDTNSTVPNGGNQPEGPGAPGEPAPIDGKIYILLITGLILIVYFQRKNNKISI